MKRRIAFLVLLLLFSCAIVFLYISNDNYAKLVRNVSNVIDVTVDTNGNVYYLEKDTTKKSTFIRCLTSNGVVQFQFKLKDGFTYKYLQVDENNKIFVSVKPSDISVKPYVEVYGITGKKIKTLFEQPKKNNNTAKTTQIAAYNLTIQDARIVFFTYDQLSKLLNMQTYDTNNESTFLKSYQFMENVHISDVICTKNGDVYYIDNNSKLFKIEKNKVKNITLQSANAADTQVMPFKMSINNNKLYFTDAHNFSFVQLNTETDKTENIEDFFGVSFRDIRNVVYKNGCLIGISPLYQDNDKGNSEIIYIKNENVFRLDKATLSSKLALIKFIVLWAYVVAIFVGIYILWYIFFRLRKWMVKVFVVMLITAVAAKLFVPPVYSSIMNDLMLRATNTQLSTIASYASHEIIGDELEKVKFPQTPEDEFYKSLLHISTNKFQNDLFFFLYYVKDNVPYVGFEIAADNRYTYSGMQVEYYTNKFRSQRFLNDYKTIGQHSGETADLDGNWRYVLVPVLNSNKSVVGYFETGINVDTLETEISQRAKEMANIVVYILVFVLAFLLFFMWRSFASLGKLKKAVDTMADGNFDMTIHISTNDEVEDISEAFNKMSSRLSEYLNSITKLNAAYGKFVPVEIFELLNRKNILDVRAGDKEIRDICILSISTGNDSNDDLSFLMINDLFTVSAQIIQRTNGVVENFYGTSLRAIYKDKTDDALLAALGIVNKFEGNQSSIKLIIQNRDTMIGVIGDANRMTSALSYKNTEEIENMMEDRNIPVILTESAMEKITAKDKYNFRFVANMQGEKLFDVIEAYPFLDRQTKLENKYLLEEGVSAYYEGDFSIARKKFITVLQTDARDQIAKAYVFLCDEQIDKTI